MRKLKSQTWNLPVRSHAIAIFAITSFIGVVIGLLSFWYGEDLSRQRIEFILINGLYWIVILYLIWWKNSHSCPDYFGLPKVKKFLSGERLLIVENAPWLGMGVFTTIYVVEDNVEKLVCVGKVINVQINDLVQILVQQNDLGYPTENDILEVFERTNSRKILVKPAIYGYGA